MIDLIILDIDGVLTDGRKYYGIDGMPFIKTYCDKDFTAIKRLRGAGIKVCFLSGDERINKAMAKNRNIDFYSARGKDKADFLSEFTEIYDTTPNNMLYVGDDLFDLSIMKLVGFSFCPNDAPNKIKEYCKIKNDGVIDTSGGNNVIVHLVDSLLDRNLIEDATMQQIEELDKNEKF